MGLKATLKATAKNLKTSSSYLESPIEEYVGYEVTKQGLGGPLLKEEMKLLWEKCNPLLWNILLIKVFKYESLMGLK